MVQRVLNRMEDNFQDATVALAYSDSIGALSQLEVAITAMMARLRTVLMRIETPPAHWSRSARRWSRSTA